MIKRFLVGVLVVTCLLLTNFGSVSASSGLQYTVVFTSNDTWTVPGDVTSVDVLVVAGGGGAGKGTTTTWVVGGGGGAGGLIWTENYTVTPNSDYSIVVGVGGVGSTSTDREGGMGHDSKFGDNLTARGGGGGGSGLARPGLDGGSGGGAGRNSGDHASGGSGLQPGQSGDSGTYGYGEDGATSTSSGAGGGGGAGGVGTVTAGGPGMDLSVELGIDYGDYGVFAAGGSAQSDASSGAANTGDGGNAAAANSDANGGSGGSGVVIVRYCSSLGEVETGEVGGIGRSIATFYGDITSLGADVQCSSRGFVYDNVSRSMPVGDPSSSGYSDNLTEFGSFSTGVYSLSATDLGGGETYYVRAWAENLGGYFYGDEVSFTTINTILWFEPNTIIIGNTLIDRAGGHDGVIAWGSNPGTLEVSIGGLEPAVSPTAPGMGLGETPGVLPPPGIIDMGATTGAAGTGLPLQANFQRAAYSLGWSLPVTYSVFFMIVAIVVGVGGLVASGTIWGWVAGFGATAALFGAVTDSTGSLVMPIWLTILCVMFAVFSGYVWRYT